VPAGAGLSSSAALECAVVAAVCELSGLDLTRQEWVAIARQAENDYVGAPTGGMDQLASVNGQIGHVLFCDMRSLSVTPVPFDLDSAGLALLVIDSNAPHRLTDSPYAQRRASCEQAAAELGVAALRDIAACDLDEALTRLSTDVLRKRARHVITENARSIAVCALLSAGHLTEIGPLLTASHASLRDDYEVSVPEVDLAVEVMLGCGAYGARITGGGFGGCAIALVDRSTTDQTTAAVAAAFANEGYPPPRVFAVRAGAGTHRVTIDRAPEV
jgi:galactokinase